MPPWLSSTSGPASAILGIYLLVQCISASAVIDDLAIFCVGAAIPTLILLGYNQLAFGSPWEMGYFHHATAEFAEVHNRGQSARPVGSRIDSWAGSEACSGAVIAD